ncbi:hypothetical protein [Nocardioides acrostichi]|uniref:Uncharacterized protein n=1 Tax=Nocardioides acrostichi TaxID=2784339 RepID=A0A930V1F0_9ACTN|nr:hypothetical protein [Nocardioides acrostichi]MBF4162121.1 hypothetical protein [Nocardioides acrostichi]
MTDHDQADQLEQALADSAEQISVGPPPLVALHAQHLQASRRRRVTMLAAAAAVVVLAVALPTALLAHDDAAPQPADSRSDELAHHDGRPCPTSLVEPGSPRLRGGDIPPVPDLSGATRAWVCRFGPAHLGRDNVTWPALGNPVELQPRQLSRLVGLAARLKPYGGTAACNGPNTSQRWMLTTATADGDLTSLVVDDYECRETTFRADPWSPQPIVGPYSGSYWRSARLLDALQGAYAQETTEQETTEQDSSPSVSSAPTCPTALPRTADTVGTDPADSAVGVTNVTGAVVCRFVRTDRGFALAPRRGQRPVPEAQLGVLSSKLADLEPAEHPDACEYLSDRYAVIVTTSDRDHAVGIFPDVCSHVQLTAFPGTTPPGQGALGGLYQQPAGLDDLVRSLYLDG